MTTLVLLLAFTTAGFAVGWFARGGRSEEAPDPLAELAGACAAARDDAGPRTRERLRAALVRAEEADVDLERRLGTDDPRYRRFEEELNALLSAAHRLDAPRT